MNKNVPKLRFKEFNDEWFSYKIKDICKLSSGSTPSKLKKEYFTGDMLWLTSGELRDKYLYETIDNITEAGRVDARLKVYDIGTFLIAIYGLEAAGVRGKSTILGEKATISQACMALEPNFKMISEYLYYWYEKYGNLIGLKYAQGTKQQNLSTNLVGDLDIKTPSLQEQKKIADFFTILDSLIEEQDGKVRDLELYKKSMMQKIFSQEIRFKDENGCDYPEWKKQNLGTIIEEPKKIKVENAFEIELITVKLYCKGIQLTGKYPNDTKNGRPYYKRFIGEMLIGRQNMHNGGIGLVRKETDGKIASNAISSYVMKTKDRLEFIYLVLSNPDFYRRIDILIGGTGQKEISKGEIEKLKIQIPCLEEQNKIVQCLSNIDNLIEEEKKNLDDLREMKKGLLQQMFV